MRLSGSRYHLAVLCGYAFRPDIHVPERPPGPAALLGTETHSYVEAKKKGEDVAFYSPDAIRIGERAVAWLEDVDVPTAIEIPIVYDAEADTARRVEAKGHREYGDVHEMEIPVTLDLVWVYDDHVVVRDLKTGSKSHAHREQLIIQALAATRLYGKRRARVGFLWARKTKADADDLEELDEATLEAESWRVASVLRSIPRARPMTGTHCFYCPLGRDMCPAHQQPTNDGTTNDRR